MKASGGSDEQFPYCMQRASGRGGRNVFSKPLLNIGIFVICFCTRVC
jgi:hypothetical protein